MLRSPERRQQLIITGMGHPAVIKSIKDSIGVLTHFLEAERIPPFSSRRAVDPRGEEFFNRYSYRGNRYIPPPNSLIYFGESDWTEFKLK